MQRSWHLNNKILDESEFLKDLSQAVEGHYRRHCRRHRLSLGLL
ncbi:MAG: hypothetical protein ACI8XX_001596 [Polaribacter sp.]|jgi:hypothetical protein